jgi:lysyl-tRNA synthetase class 1
MNLDPNQLIAWPFKEAKKILDRINHKTPAKGYVLFETGYGPSGLPHIGTFGEVARTAMVIKAMNILAPEIPTKLFVYSDDMDGLRKVPENIPNPDMIRENIGKPLTDIPDPYGEQKSYAHYMNNKLNTFLKSFGFEYEFCSSTEHYKSGKYNEMLHLVALNCDKILEVMRPTLQEERRASYHPILPICQKTGKFIFDGVIGVDPEKNTITFKDEEDDAQTISLFDGNCKLQWKADWAMRWAELGVDYEMFGKDIQPSADLSSQICQILGKKAPVQFRYELFTDAEGKKISKSKGNGVSVDEWLKYGTLESLLLFMYEKPETSKKLYLEIIPKEMDKYIKYAQKYNSETDENLKMNSPIFHLPLKPRAISSNFKIDFSLISNLASCSNPENSDILKEYVHRYQTDLTKDEESFVDDLIEKAMNFYNDFEKGLASFPEITPETIQKLSVLKNCLIEAHKEDPAITENDWQNVIYKAGRDLGYDKTNMRSWFEVLYKNLFGKESGPRFGSFISIYGYENFLKLIDGRIG